MTLLTVLSSDQRVHDAVRQPSGPVTDVAHARSWERLEWLIRERPVTGVVLDGSGLEPGLEPAEAVADLLRRFPSLAVVFAYTAQADPLTLFRLGRASIDGLALVDADSIESALHAAVVRAQARSTEAHVVRAIGPWLPLREVSVVRGALRGAQMGWGAAELARDAALSRAHLSVRLRRVGLPSAGHLLLWAKLLHAGRWLADPGRTAESISRQLEYSSGAAFRRALRNYVGGTPTQVRDGGGLAVVLSAFLDACGLRASLGRSPA